jgi:hypothetical protein
MTQAGPSMLGTGMYQDNPYNINQQAFNNPAGAFAGQLGMQLGQTGAGSFVANAGGPIQANTNAATTAGINGQLGLANTYGQMAAGNGPSLANVQAQQQGQQNLAAAQSMLGSARGAGDPAAAQLAARNALTQGQQQVAQNAVQGRTAEELGALSAQGGLYGSVAGQGLQASGQANQIAQGNQATNLAANTTQLGAQQAADLAQQQGSIAGQQLGVQSQLGNSQIQSTAFNNAAQANTKLAGAALQGAGGLVGGFL